jgi:alpha-1,2-mannosyltransferase
MTQDMSPDSPQEIDTPAAAAAYQPPTTKTSWMGPLALGLLALALALTIVYYLCLWKDFGGFVSAFHPNNKTTFPDFEQYFYPTGKEVLTSGEPVKGFYYSAFGALLFVPLSRLPLDASLWCWGILQAVAAVWMCALSGAVASKNSLRTFALSALLCITSFALLNNFAWGQVSVLITLCILASLHAHQRGRPVSAGIWLGLGAAIKYYPAIFLVYFLLKRDFRAIVTCLITAFVLFVVVPVAFLGVHDWMQFNKLSYTSVTDANWINKNPGSQCFANVFARVTPKFYRSLTPNDVALLARVGTIVGFLIALDNLGLIWALQKKVVRNKLALSAATLFLTLPFIVKTSWLHYFVFLPFCQIAVFAEIGPLFQNRKVWAIVAAALNAFSIALGSVFAFQLFASRHSYAEWGMLLYANIAVLLAVYVVVTIAKREMPETKAA